MLNYAFMALGAFSTGAAIVAVSRKRKIVRLQSIISDLELINRVAPIRGRNETINWIRDNCELVVSPEESDAYRKVCIIDIPLYFE